MRDNPIFEQLSILAQKYKVNLIPGSFVIQEGKRRYNSSCFINSNGKIMGFYDKHSLWSSEKKFLSQGKENRVFQTNIGKVAIQICADLNSSLISHEYRKLNPDLIVNLAMWSREDIKANSKKTPFDIEFRKVEILTKARAVENHCYSIFCNFAGDLSIKTKTGRIYKETSIGKSMIVDPYGNVVAQASSNKEQVLFFSIDLSKCHWSSKTPS